MGANLHMDLSGIAAGGNLVTALANHWPMEGGGPFPFPYAFASGIFEPLNMQLGATGAMWEMTILLLLLLWKPRKTSLAGTLTISLVLASLALSCGARICAAHRRYGDHFPDQTSSATASGIVRIQ